MSHTTATRSQKRSRDGQLEHTELAVDGRTGVRGGASVPMAASSSSSSSNSERGFNRRALLLERLRRLDSLRQSDDMASSPPPEQHYLSTTRADLNSKVRSRSEELDPSTETEGPSSSAAKRRRRSVEPGESAHSQSHIAQLETFLSSSTFRLSQQSDRPDTSTLAAHDYDVDVRSGFLPPQPPLRRLPVEFGFEKWEERLDEARRIYVELGPEEREGGGEGEGAEDAGGEVVDDWDERWEAWKEGVRRMDTLSTDSLHTIPLLRRAHLVLSFVSHFYVHCSLPTTTTTITTSSSPDENLPEIPASLATPWLEVSDRLDIPPILTYADTVLWNWGLKDPSRGFDKDNVEILTTFTSTPSEQHFFFTSLLIEYYGVPALRLMSFSLDEAFLSDSTSSKRISSYLEQLSVVIIDITKLLEDVRKACDPRRFYWEERVWFNGGRWRYLSEGAGGGERVLEYGGPSAGQSSLVHALDLFLGVDHSPRRPTTSGDGDAAATPAKMSEHDTTFMQRMQLYMPHHHRLFLSHLASLSSSLPSASASASASTSPSPTHLAPKTPSIRSLALTSPPSSPLRKSYDAAIEALKVFRDAHVRIVYLYIVQQSKGTPPKGGLGWRVEERKRLIEVFEEVKANGVAGEVKKVLKGTGGTDLVRFLKLCRDRTVEAVIGDLRDVLDVSGAGD